MEKQIINGVEVTEDGDTTHFVIHDEEQRKEQKNDEGLLKRIWNWLVKHDAKPYVKIRDLADPFGDREDSDAGCDGKNCIEAGVKIRF